MNDDLDFDEAWSLHRGLKRLFAPGPHDVAALDEVKRLCESASQAIDDPYCRNVLRAIEECATSFFASDTVPTALGHMYRMIQYLLVDLEGRMIELEKRSVLHSARAGSHYRASHRLGS